MKDIEFPNVTLPSTVASLLELPSYPTVAIKRPGTLGVPLACPKIPAVKADPIPG